MVQAAISSKQRDEHGELRRAMVRFVRLMHDPAGADLGAIARERVIFSRLFSRHLGEERSALIATGDEAVLPLVKEYDQRVATLRASYSAHVNGWTPAAITARWPDYVQAVLGLQGRLHDMMEWEERTLPNLH